MLRRWRRYRQEREGAWRGWNAQPPSSENPWVAVGIVVGVVILVGLVLWVSRYTGQG